MRLICLGCLDHPDSGKRYTLIGPLSYKVRPSSCFWWLERPTDDVLLLCRLPVCSGSSTFCPSLRAARSRADSDLLPQPLSPSVDVQMEVDSVEPEPGSPLEKTLTSMRERGVKLIYGNWLIEGAPRVILFDTGSMYHRYVSLLSLLLASMTAQPERTRD